MLNGWSMAIETTGGIIGIETCWDGSSINLFYPADVNVPIDLINQTLWAHPIGKTVCTKRQNAYYTGNLRFIKDGNITSSSWKALGICTYNKSHSEGVNMDDQSSTPNSIMQAYTGKFITLLLEIAKLTGDIKAVDLDSGCFSLYSTKMFYENDYDLIRKEDLAGDPYYYTKNSDGIEIMFEVDPEENWELTSNIIRCPTSNALDANTIIELIKNLDNSDGTCDPLTFALFRKIAKL